MNVNLCRCALTEWKSIAGVPSITLVYDFGGMSKLVRQIGRSRANVLFDRFLSNFYSDCYFNLSRGTQNRRTDLWRAKLNRIQWWFLQKIQFFWSIDFLHFFSLNVETRKKNDPSKRKLGVTECQRLLNPGKATAMAICPIIVHFITYHKNYNFLENSSVFH